MAMTPARKHLMRVKAAEEAAKAAETQVRPDASQYELMLAKLYEDKRRLKGVESMKTRAEIKRELLPEYEPYITGVLQSDAGAQDDVLTTIMLWCIDAGDYSQALELATYAMRHNLSMADAFSRSLPCLLAEQKEKRGFPYLVMRTPADLEDYAVNDVGALTRIVFKETDEEDREQYRIYDLEGWKIARSPDGTGPISSGAYDLDGLLPVIPLHSTEPLKPTDITAAPWVWPIAVANWELFNKVSELDEILRAQTFSVLTLPVSEDADVKRYEGLSLSTETGLIYNSEGGGKPEYLAPPDGPARVYMDWIAALIEKIYKLSGLEFTGGTKATASASGVALSFQFQEANNNLSGLAELCEKAERQMAKIFGLWTQHEVEDLSVSYPRDFNVVDLEAEVKRGLDALTMGISETFDKELKKSLARRLLGEGVPDKVLARIDEEIESAEVYENQPQNEIDQETDQGNNEQIEQEEE